MLAKKQPLVRRRSGLRASPAQSVFRQRTGAAAVEAALLIPLLLMIAMGVIDVGQLIVVKQNVSNASRIGARQASRDATVNVIEIEAAVVEYFSDAFPALSSSELNESVTVNTYDEEGSLLSGNDIEELETGSQIRVEVQLDFAAVQWLGVINYWDLNLQPISSFSRRE